MTDWSGAAEWNSAFGVWDVNGDGIVNQNEWLLDGGFGTLDVDANAALTQAEWNSAMVSWDVDNDGFLDPNEMIFCESRTRPAPSRPQRGAGRVDQLLPVERRQHGHKPAQAAWNRHAR